MEKPKLDKVAAVPAAPQANVITEYALYDGAGDQEQGKFSHASLPLVRARAVLLLGESLTSGGRAPALRIVKRVCTHPLNANGSVNVARSTVEETEIEV
jgi:hypothetical protein